MAIKIFAFLVLAALTAASPAAFAEAQEYTPSVGQEGKDVIWVPTPQELITAMLDAAGVKADDYVIDLGSGDGRIVIAAAKRGARAMGVEYNPDMVELSRRNAKAEGVAERATFVQADIFETDFSKASVLTMYLLPDINLKLRPKVLDLKPGTRVVSHAFDMGEWRADKSVSADGRTAYMWIVPAKVDGAWACHTPAGDAVLTLKQTFQVVDGTFKLNGKEMPLKTAHMAGDEISFSVADSSGGPIQYNGHVNGTAIEGVAKSANGSETKWTATRQK
jgi:SAM-dependent methyltransferase